MDAPATPHSGKLRRLIMVGGGGGAFGLDTRGGTLWVERTSGRVLETVLPLRVLAALSI